MAEKKTGEGTVDADQPEFESDTTGNEPIDGTRHVMQDKLLGVVDQDASLREAKDAGAAPANKAKEAAPSNKASKRSAKR